MPKQPNVLTKERVLELIRKDMNANQCRLAQAMIDTEMDLVKASELLKIKKEYLQSQWYGTDSNLIRAYTILSLIKIDTGVKRGNVIPTLEWNLEQLMTLYEDYQERFNELKATKDTIEDYDDRMESIKSKMQALLKQITEFQAKFGQKIDEDVMRINKLSDDELAKEFDALIRECGLYINKSKWHNKKYTNEVAVEEAAAVV